MVSLAAQQRAITDVQGGSRSPAPVFERGAHPPLARPRPPTRAPCSASIEGQLEVRRDLAYAQDMQAGATIREIVDHAVHPQRMANEKDLRLLQDACPLHSSSFVHD